jgi:hypothetical protein
MFAHRCPAWLIVPTGFAFGLSLMAFALMVGGSNSAWADESGDRYEDLGGDAVYDPYDLDSQQGAWPITNNDTRVILQGGPTVVRESSYQLSNTYSVDFDPRYARSFALGLEQDLLSGFGVNLRLSSVAMNFDQVTDSNAATWAVTGGDYTSFSVTPGVHYRLENDVLEPYIHLGLGRASYDFSGNWNATAYSNKETALLYDFGIGIDYVTEGGLIIGLYEHSQILDDPKLTDGGGTHTFGIRVGFEMQNQFW